MKKCELCERELERWEDECQCSRFDDEPPTCPLPKCDGGMRRGRAIATQDVGARQPCFGTHEHDGEKLVDVWKCSKCGHTVSRDHKFPARKHALREPGALDGEQLRAEWVERNRGK